MSAGTTGPELFYNFRLCLFGTARDDWEIVVENVDETVEAFEQCIATFKRTFMTNATKQNMVDYIQSIKKPHSMDVRLVSFVAFARSIATSTP